MYELQDELDEIEFSWNNFIKRRLILWLIRQALSFTIVGVITYFKPSWSWLWWVAIAIAVISLITMLIANYWFQGKIRNMDQRFADEDTTPLDSNAR
jgi:ABC-type transport system involved in Fe-S cluster assembly fused permease/ATPase subunit